LDKIIHDSVIIFLTCEINGITLAIYGLAGAFPVLQAMPKREGGNPMYKLEDFMADLERRNPGEPEFIQAAAEVIESIIDVVNDNPVYVNGRILERITEPDRVFSFKVEWEDDNGDVQVNRGYRVQFNNAIGPYKGGLRFHPA
jgi:hypothetical protein